MHQRAENRQSIHDSHQSCWPKPITRTPVFVFVLLNVFSYLTYTPKTRKIQIKNDALEGVRGNDIVTATRHGKSSNKKGDSYESPREKEVREPTLGCTGCTAVYIIYYRTSALSPLIVIPGAGSFSRRPLNRYSEIRETEAVHHLIDEGMLIH